MPPHAMMKGMIRYLKKPDVAVALVVVTICGLWNRMFFEMGGLVLLSSFYFRDASVSTPLLVLLFSPLLFFYYYLIFFWHSKVTKKWGGLWSALIILGGFGALNGLGKGITRRYYPRLLRKAELANSGGMPKRKKLRPEIIGSAAC